MTLKRPDAELAQGSTQTLGATNFDYQSLHAPVSTSNFSRASFGYLPIVQLAKWRSCRSMPSAEVPIQSVSWPFGPSCSCTPDSGFVRTGRRRFRHDRPLGSFGPPDRLSLCDRWIERRNSEQSNSGDPRILPIRLNVAHQNSEFFEYRSAESS